MAGDDGPEQAVRASSRAAQPAARAAGTRRPGIAAFGGSVRVADGRTGASSSFVVRRPPGPGRGVAGRGCRKPGAGSPPGFGGRAVSGFVRAHDAPDAALRTCPGSHAACGGSDAACTRSRTACPGSHTACPGSRTACPGSYTACPGRHAIDAPRQPPRAAPTGPGRTHGRLRGPGPRRSAPDMEKRPVPPPRRIRPLLAAMLYVTVPVRAPVRPPRPPHRPGRAASSPSPGGAGRRPRPGSTPWPGRRSSCR